MKKILITGATGLVGSSLVKHLSEDNIVFAITRSEKKYDNQNIENVICDYKNENQLIEYIEQSNVVIHLVGENVGKQLWTKSFKQKLFDSRIHTTHYITGLIKRFGSEDIHYIQASAVGYYGPLHKKNMIEESENGSGFLADLCKQWEDVSITHKYRKTFLRFGIILSKDASIIKKMYLPFKIGLGAVLGKGKNHISWIHLNDVIGAIRFCITNKLTGPVNIVSPNSIESTQFYKKFANALNRNMLFKLPSFLLSIVGKTMKNEFLLADHRVVPKKLMDSGFKFKHDDLDLVFRNIFK